MWQHIGWRHAFADIVREACEPCEDVVDLRCNLVNDKHRVLKRIALWMERDRLCLADQREELGERRIEQPRGMQPSKKLRRPPRRERPRKLAKQPFRRLGQQFLATIMHVSKRLIRDGKLEQRRLPRRPQGAHGVFREVLGDGAHAMLCDVFPPAIRVEQLSVRQLPRHAVHRRVAAVEVFLNRDLGRERDIEAAVPRPGLALAPRKGDLAGAAIDGHEVDGKRTADARGIRE